MYDLYTGDRIVGERNYGGDMVKNTINMYAKSIGRNDVSYKDVVASRGKHVRAEPVSVLYKKGLIHHVGRDLKKLEDEMASYVPGQAESPNRLDALVWVFTELLVKQPKRMPRIGLV